MLFLDSSLEEAFPRTASLEGEFHHLLLVNIQIVTMKTEVLPLAVLLSIKTCGLLIESHCVFFQTTSDTKDAMHFLDHFKVSKLPCVLALLDPEQQKVLWDIQGWCCVPSATPALDFGSALSDALHKHNGKQLGVDSLSSSKSRPKMSWRNETFTAPPPIDVPKKTGFQKAVMTRTSPCGCKDAEEFFELQRALEESQQPTDEAGIDCTILKCKASTKLWLSMSAPEHTASAAFLNEDQLKSLHFLDLTCFF